MALTVGSLFSGIGGIDLGLERAGMSVVWQCEADPYCRAVLRKHWPSVPCYEDVRTVGAELSKVNVLAGGFPCQPVSLAGRRRGAADDRWLWPEFARLIRVLRPRYALMENVPGLLAGDGMAEVLGDLAACGYDAEWDCIPAAAVGAPHLRYRVFILAYAKRRGLQSGRRPGELEGAPGSSEGIGSQRQRFWNAADGRGEALAHAGGSRSAARVSESTQREGGDSGVAVDASDRRRRRSLGDQWAIEPNVGRVAHGIPSRVDRLRALGNAVVPQVAELIGRRIVESLR